MSVVNLFINTVLTQVWVYFIANYTVLKYLVKERIKIREIISKGNIHRPYSLDAVHQDSPWKKISSDHFFARQSFNREHSKSVYAREDGESFFFSFLANNWILFFSRRTWASLTLSIQHALYEIRGFVEVLVDWVVLQVDGWDAQEVDACAPVWEREERKSGPAEWMNPWVARSPRQTGGADTIVCCLLGPREERKELKPFWHAHKLDNTVYKSEIWGKVEMNWMTKSNWLNRRNWSEVMLCK